MNLVVTSVSAATNKYGMLTKEDTLFSPLLCVLQGPSLHNGPVFYNVCELV